MGIIYCVYCVTTGKYYIGQTCMGLEHREKTHWYNRKNNTLFHKALCRFGRSNFIWEVLEDDVPDYMLNSLETFYIHCYDSFENGYNSDIGGGLNRVMYDKIRGWHHSEETKKRLSEVHKGKTFTEEHKKKLSIAKRNMSEETKKKLSEARKGKPSWNKGRVGLQAGEKNSMYGKHHSEETKRKISEKRKEYLKKKKEGLL